MNIRRLVIFLLNFIPIIMLTSEAAEVGHKLKIAIPDNFPPFYYSDKDGQLKGASYEIAVQIYKKLGYEIEVTQFPNMRLMLSALDNGSHDVTINLTATDERREVAFFTSTPHIYETHNLIVRSNSQINFRGSLGELEQYKIGPVFGWTYGPEFDHANYLKKEYVNNSEQQLKGLLSGRYDIAINNPQFVQFLASQLKITKAFRILEPAVYKLPVSMAVSRNYPGASELVNSLNNEIKSFLKDKAYQEILNRYGFGTSSQPITGTP